MISGREFADALVCEGIDVAVGVPCSHLRPLLSAFEDSPEIVYIPATCEAEAVGIAAGAWIAGRSPLLVMQNSGFLESLNTIASLLIPMEAPIPFLVSGRGGFDVPDELHHIEVARSFSAFTRSMGLPSSVCRQTTEGLPSQLGRLWRRSAKVRRPSVMVVPPNTLTKDDHTAPLAEFAYAQGNEATRSGWTLERTEGRPFSRRDAVVAIMENLPENSVVIAGIGFVGRELFSVNDRELNLYLAGAMGCASAVGLGLSVFGSLPTVILDGDGAALMRLGNLVTIGHARPRSFAHVLFNNGQYESTGGQVTNGRHIEFCKIASDCGYVSSLRFWNGNDLGRAIREMTQPGDVRSPFFAEVMIGAGSPELPRPPVLLAERVRQLRRAVAGEGR